MKFSPTLLVAIAAACVGFAAFWANPRRAVNRLFFSGSLHASLWLFAWQSGFVSEDGLFWLRIATSIGALVPLHLWILKEAVVMPQEFFSKKIRRGWPWILISAGLAVIPYTAWFIPPESTAEAPIRGFLFHGYTAGLIVAYLALLRQTLLQIRAQTGAMRLELQVLLLGACAAGGSIVFLMGLRAVWGDFWLVRLRPQPIFVLFFYTVTVVAITTYRIFDARQILLVGIQKFALIGLIAGTAFATYYGLELLLPPLVAWLGATAVSLWVAAMLNDRLDRLLQFYPAATTARQAAYSAAQRESRSENLENAFLSVLKGWGQADRAVILVGNKDALSGQGIELPGDGTVVQALDQLVWATPERLMRERHTPTREALKQFLADNQLGIATIVKGPSLKVFVGVGYSASRRPFTYPQVTQLMELGSIMESALERSHFSAKVQHTEQLATVGLLGASLAHEIRNPLVTIKTFVQLLPRHYDDAAFRNKFFKLIGDEVTRIDALTEQLLDLASPRMYVPEMIELHSILHASLDLVSAKASHKNVQFLTEFEATPDHAYTDASAAKQVMLNLCFNAIQAVEAQEGERWVKIGTRNTRVGIEMAVADSGPGIAPEIRPRLFQPFQTTKSTGFGLGLAICSDILANLNASITVDPPEPGRGATFRVIFPCQPLSS